MIWRADTLLADYFSTDIINKLCKYLRNVRIFEFETIIFHKNHLAANEL
jgi:phosphopantetheine adenylyltransferase